jgi:hypothetical protein
VQQQQLRNALLPAPPQPNFSFIPLLYSAPSGYSRQK